MITSYDVIKYRVSTEKNSLHEDNNQYVFSVAKTANKVQIRQAIKEIYKVDAVSIQTMIVRGKRKRVRQWYGSTSPWKKAIVRLKEGQKIEVAA